jgi:hypothetical protein
VLSHSGAGGSVAWADLDERFSAAICHNRMLRPDSDRPDEHMFHGLGEAVRALIRSSEAARPGLTALRPPCGAPYGQPAPGTSTCIISILLCVPPG